MRVQRRGKTTVEYLARLDKLGVSDRDLKWAYAGALLRYVTYLELQLEDLFLGSLYGFYVFGSRDVRPIVNVTSRQTARRLVNGGRNYIDWLPYEQTVDRANVFFTAGRPFSGLDAAHADSLRVMVWIRNALAHESEHALGVFERKVVAGRVLPSRETTPMGYLTGLHAGTQTRLEYHIAKSVAAFRALCS